jgi:hypothetical protein
LKHNDKEELRRALTRARVEKLSEPIHSKLPFSVSSWLLKHVGKGHVSEFVRESILERLERMAGDE